MVLLHLQLSLQPKDFWSTLQKIPPTLQMETQMKLRRNPKDGFDT